MKHLLKIKHEYITQVTKDIPDDLEDIKEEVSHFELYPSIQSFKINWSTDNNTFLAQIGLPSSAPSMIEFGPITHNLEEYIEIGYNNYGDKIVIMKATGIIANINHDSSNRIDYINKDAISLFKSICAYLDLMKGDNSFPDRIKDFDKEAFNEGNWWNTEFHNYTHTRCKR